MLHAKLKMNSNGAVTGTTLGIGAIETIMEHIAWTLKKDPLEVRMTNFIQKGDPLIAVPGLKFEEENPLPGMIQEFKQSADYDDRKKFVETFNQVYMQKLCFVKK